MNNTSLPKPSDYHQPMILYQFTVSDRLRQVWLLIFCAPIRALKRVVCLSFVGFPRFCAFAVSRCGVASYKFGVPRTLGTFTAIPGCAAQNR